MVPSNETPFGTSNTRNWMLCEKCHAKPVKVHVHRMRSDSGEPLSKPVDQHFCEDCARDYIQRDPTLNQAKWSEPTLHLKIHRTEPCEQERDSPGGKDSTQP